MGLFAVSGVPTHMYKQLNIEIQVEHMEHSLNT
jgi:hypothetical protein